MSHAKNKKIGVKIMVSAIKCPRCNGTGREMVKMSSFGEIESLCQKCFGSGRIEG